MNDFIIKILIFLFGASIGSFAYAFAFRFPVGRPWVTGRSQCESCGHILSWFELLPLVSFIAQKGKCIKCDKFIGWGYLLSELSMGLIFLFLGNNFLNLQLTTYSLWHFIFQAALLFIFFVIAVIDLKHLIIPDSLIIAGFFIAIFSVTFGPAQDWNANFNLANNLLVGAVLGSTFFLMWLATRGVYIGLGDAKLIALIGFLFGFPGAIWVLMIATTLGIIIGIYLMARKMASRRTPLPFGTFLGIASILYILFSFYIGSFFLNILLL